MTTKQSGIFINYRRDDSAGHVGRLYDGLRAHFGHDQVFMDIDRIDYGDDFVQVLEDAVGACRALLVVIGRHWLTSSEGGCRRLDNPKDFVRIEISSALKRNVRVIPVLVHGATMPTEDTLPTDIVQLARRNAIEISDVRWPHDVERLIETLEKVISPGGNQPASIPEETVTSDERRVPSGPQSRWGILGNILSGISFGFNKHYNRQVINEHGVLNVSGLGLINAFALELDQVFVDLRIAPSTSPQLATMDPLTTRELEGTRPVWEYLQPDTNKFLESMALTIIGPPGCGKTTLLQHLALAFAGGRQRRHGVRDAVPLLLFLRNHADRLVEVPHQTLGSLAQDYFGDARLFDKLNPPSEWFERQLERGRCIVMLDGLDEVADLKKRQIIATWIDRQIKNYPSCRFIVTARPQGYREAPLQRAHVLEVQPFNAEQISRFITSWYLANEIMSEAGIESERARLKAANGSSDLLDRIRKMPTLAALTVNPLLLTMIAMVHRYKKALPGSRADLYAQICEVLLTRRREDARSYEARSYQGLSTAQKLVVLRRLATHMMANRLRDIGFHAAMEIIRDPLERVGIIGHERESFFINLQANSGLLLEREAGLWSFAHLTFQEYLNAAQWLDRKEDAPNWPELVGDGWWHETLRLYAAQGDATSLVQACLDVNTVASMMLAAECVDEAREIEPSLRRAVTTRLLQDAESSDPERRRFAADVLLSRRLRAFQRIDEGRDIDLGYVTCAEYQLFLDEMRGRIKYHHPDHWDGPNFPAGTARDPVTGLRAEDATAFCHWLTQRQGESVAYRLPTLREAQDYASEEEGKATWCRDGINYSLHGLGTKAEQEINRQLANAPTLDLPLPPLKELEGSRIRARDLALAYALSRTHLKNNNLSWALDLTINQSRVTSLGLSPERARELQLDSDLDINLAEHLRRVLMQARALNLSRTFRTPHSLGLRRSLDLAHALAIDLDMDLDQQTALSLDFDFARKLAHDLAHDVARSVLFAEAEEVYNNSKNFGDELLDRALSMMKMSDFATIQMISLFQGMVSAARSQSYSVTRQEQRKYVLLMLEYIYVNCKRIKDDMPGQIRRGKSAAEIDYLIMKPEQVLEIYWWLQIVEGRQAGRLPAWEGLRLVRERNRPSDSEDL